MSARPAGRVCAHRHGTRQRSSPRACHLPCTCTPCRAAYARYQRELAAARRSARPPKTATGPAAAHLAALAAAGMTYRQICAAAGVGKGTLDRIRAAGQDGTMLTFTAELLLSVPVPVPVTGGQLGSVRRLKALAAVGWTLRGLSAELGVDHHGVARIVAGRRATTAQLDRAVRELYDRLYATDGPSRHAAARAKRLGWAPPQAWASDADLDSPLAGPARPAPPCRTLGARRRTEVDREIVRRLCGGEPAGRATRAEREAAVRWLTGPGRCSDAQAAARTGLSRRHITRIRSDLALPAAAPAARARPA